MKVALPLLGVMSTGDVAVNYLNSTNYMFLGGLGKLLMLPWRRPMPVVAVTSIILKLNILTLPMYSYFYFILRLCLLFQGRVFFGQSILNTWAKEFLNFMLGFKSAILAIFQSWCKQFFWQETSFETWYLLKISLTCPTSQGPPNPGFRSVDINSLTWSTLLLLD